MGGCGFWKGFGRTSRGGTFQNCPSHENCPSSQIRGIIRSDSSHIARVLRGSIPMPICSYGAERPVPNSTRPPAMWTTTATPSATRRGRGHREGGEEVVLDEPDRVEPHPIGEHALLEGFLDDRVVVDDRPLHLV